MLRLLFVATLIIMPSATAMAQGETRPAEFDGRVENFITTFDYPDSSLRGEEQGMTSVRYEVNEVGRVTPGSCVVTASSGHRRLDERSCEVIERRFAFRPALQDGRPVKETRVQDIFWRLPGVREEDGMRDVSIRKVVNYGSCIARTAPSVAQTVVDLPLGAPEQAAAVTAIDGVKLKCWTKFEEVKAPPTLMAGSLAEALFELRFADRPLPTLPAGAMVLATRNGTEALAHCVVRRDPGAVRELLASIPTGPAEGSAIARIVPHLQPCVVAGTTLRFTKASMRALFAIALYRDVAHAAAAPR